MMREDSKQWTFLSNHAHVLVCMARNPDVRSRDMASLVGITERRVFKIISELENSGLITRKKEGRRNHYEFDFSVTLRHPLEEETTVGQFLKVLLDKAQCKKIGLI